MGITKTRDGRYLVGQGVTDGNEYKGSLAWRDIVIQLSADGATAESIEKLEFLRDYGLYHSGEGNSVMPPSVSVWISNNGTTTAVEADDITVDGSNYTICGIKWNGSAWDFSQAGQGGGGGGLPPYTSADKGKVLTVGEGSESETVTIVPEQTVTIETDDDPVPLVGADTSGFVDGNTGVMTVNGVDYNATAYDAGGGIIYESSDIMFAITYFDGVVAAMAANPGTYTLSLTDSIPSVEPKWEAGSPFIISCTGTATASEGQLLIPINKTLAEIEEQCFVDASNEDYRFKVPVYLNLPSVNPILTEYNYSDDSFMILLASENAIYNEAVIYENSHQEYFMTVDSEDVLCIAVTSK